MTDTQEGRPLTRREIRLREMAAGTLPVEQDANHDVNQDVNQDVTQDVNQDVTQDVNQDLEQHAAALQPVAAELADEATDEAPEDDDTAPTKRTFFGLGRKQRHQNTEASADDSADESAESADSDANDNPAAPLELNESQEQFAESHQITDLENARAFIAEVEAINIDARDEHGNLRSRKELRELRLAAEAALAAKYQLAEEQTQEAVLEDTDLDDESEAALDALEEADDFDITPTDEELLDDTASPELLEDAAEDTDDTDKDAADDEIDAEAEVSAAADDEIDAEAEVSAADDDTVEVEQPASAITFTYPDISPIEETPSVFDNPALRGFATTGVSTPSSDTDSDVAFDDIITRAVVQEGAASPTNTSSLILPSMPSDDMIVAPINETGEILLTGSIALPKSLSETGSHMPLVDDNENDHLGVIDELHPSDPTITTGHMAPISAVRSVSAQSATGSLVDQTPNDRSKLPIILISSGAGLVVIAGGLLIWAAAAGLFS